MKLPNFLVSLVDGSANQSQASPSRAEEEGNEDDLLFLLLTNASYNSSGKQRKFIAKRLQHPKLFYFYLITQWVVFICFTFKGKKDSSREK